MTKTPLTLPAWRQHVAGLHLCEAAWLANIPTTHALAIEASPHRAAVGTLAAYVQACGGRLVISVEIDTSEECEDNACAGCDWCDNVPDVTALDLGAL